MRHVFYPAVVEQEGETRTVRLPDFPEIKPVRIGRDRDPFEAASDAATEVAGRYRGEGLSLPSPTPIAKHARRGRGKPAPELVFCVPVPLYRDYVRVALVVKPSELRRIDAEVDRQGMTRSAFMVRKALDGLAA